MSNENHPVPVNDDEITLKELILLVQSYVKELFSHWKWIVLAGIVVGGLMVVNTLLQDVKYNSKLTFTLEGGGKGGSALGMLSNFIGIPGAGESNALKMIELMKSRAMIESALLQKVIIDGKEDYFANHIIRLEDDVVVYTDEEETDTLFISSAEIDKTDRNTNKLINKLRGYMVGSEERAGAMSISHDEETGFVSINTAMMDEELAVEFPTVLFFEAKEFFTEKAISSNIRTLEFVTEKYDSITTLLSSKEYQLAKFKESSRGVYLETEQLEYMRLEKDVRILLEQLGELIKNKEQVAFLVQSTTPNINEVDLPVYPAKKTKISLPKNLIIGGFLGAFLMSAFLIGRRIYRETMEGEVAEA